MPQAFAFTDGTDKDGAATARIWAEAHPNEPFYPPVVSSATAEFHSKLTANLAEAAVRQPILLHQLLRAQYLQRPFLNRALDRWVAANCTHWMCVGHHFGAKALYDKHYTLVACGQSSGLVYSSQLGI